jgi:hypothetical protein
MEFVITSRRLPYVPRFGLWLMKSNQAETMPDPLVSEATAENAYFPRRWLWTRVFARC